MGSNIFPRFDMGCLQHISCIMGAECNLFTWMLKYCRLIIKRLTFILLKISSGRQDTDMKYLLCISMANYWWSTDLIKLF